MTQVIVDGGLDQVPQQDHTSVLFESTSEVTKRVVRGFLDLFVLEMLEENPKHGYDIMKNLELRTTVRVGPGTLYPLLYELERQGLVTGEWQSPRRTRKVYKITETGKIFRETGIASISKLLTRPAEPFNLDDSPWNPPGASAILG